MKTAKQKRAWASCHRSKLRSKHNPGVEWYEANEPVDGSPCPSCSRPMRHDGKMSSGKITLQHYDDGGIGFLCMQCNVSHGTSRIGSPARNRIESLSPTGGMLAVRGLCPAHLGRHGFMDDPVGRMVSECPRCTALTNPPPPFNSPLVAGHNADNTRCLLAPFQAAELAEKLHGPNSPEHLSALAVSDEWDAAIASILVSSF